MKLVERHICSFVLTVAFLLAFGNLVFANNPESLKTKTVTVEALKANNQSKPLIFVETSFFEASQSVSQTEPLVFGVWGSIWVSYNFSETKISSVSASFYSQKDKRELISQQIFPFHFFW